jgi:hypothetical protein
VPLLPEPRVGLLGLLGLIGLLPPPLPLGGLTGPDPV